VPSEHVRGVEQLEGPGAAPRRRGAVRDPPPPGTGAGLGRPVCVALPVDGPSDDWFEYWTDALATLAPGEVEFRFVLRPATRNRADSSDEQ